MDDYKSPYDPPSLEQRGVKPYRCSSGGNLKNLKTFGILTIFALFFATPFTHAMDEGAYSKKSRELLLDLAILKFQGLSNTAGYRSRALSARVNRYQKLHEKKVISGREFRSTVNESRLADLAIEEASHQVEAAQLEKAVYLNENGGKEDPAVTKDLYGRIWKNRVAMAETSLAIAKVHAVHQQWETDVMHKLVKVSAANPEVIPETELENEAAKAAVAAKEAELKLLSQTPPQVL